MLRVGMHILTIYCQYEFPWIPWELVGIICKDDSVRFESKDLSDARKIIVFSDGEV